MSNMTPSDRLRLERLIGTFNAKDTTDQIRSVRHSARIRDDISGFLNLKEKYPRIHKDEPERFRGLAESRCSFLFTKYTNIFIKLVKDELNLSIMWKFLEVLEAIEEGQIDQHEGSYLVGKLLKELYVDSALQAEEKRKEAEARKEKREKAKGVRTTTNAPKKLHWSDYKAMMERQAGETAVATASAASAAGSTSTD